MAVCVHVLTCCSTLLSQGKSSLEGLWGTRMGSVRPAQWVTLKIWIKVTHGPALHPQDPRTRSNRSRACPQARKRLKNPRPTRSQRRETNALNQRNQRISDKNPDPVNFKTFVQKIYFLSSGGIEWSVLNVNSATVSSVITTVACDFEWRFCTKIRGRKPSLVFLLPTALFLPFTRQLRWGSCACLYCRDDVTGLRCLERRVRIRFPNRVARVTLRAWCWVAP